MKKITLLTGLLILSAWMLHGQKLHINVVHGKFGFFDAQGKEVIAPKYDYAKEFNEGLAVVMKNKKYGYINPKGEVVIPLMYQSANDFCEGLAPVKQNERWGFINPANEAMVPFQYQALGKFQEGLAYAILNEKFGYIDKKGTEVVPCKYQWASDFREGLARIQLNGKWGFIDKNSKEIVPIKYETMTDLIDGFAKGSLNGTTYYVDRSGAVFEQQRTIITPNGSTLSDGKLSGQGLKSQRIGNKFGFVNANGIVVFAPEYDDARDFSEGLAAVMLGNSWGYLNTQGKNEIPHIYISAEDFSGGLAKVNQRGKWGFIDKNYREVIPIKYTAATKHSENVFLMREYDGTVVYLNRYGGELSKTDIAKVEKELHDEMVSLAGVVMDTVLGNMVIEKKIDHSGRILSIGGVTMNLEFENQEDFSGSRIYTFDIAGRKVIYFNAENKAVRCSYDLSTLEKDPLISLPHTPWPGETTPVPEILELNGQKMTVVNAVNGKTITLPIENLYNGKFIHEYREYEVSRFYSHASIQFTSKEQFCTACGGHGYIRGADTEETITKTTYRTEVNEVTSYSVYYRHFQEKKVPVVKTEKVVNPGTLETCGHCNGAPILGSVKYLTWDGEKLD